MFRSDFAFAQVIPGALEANIRDLVAPLQAQFPCLPAAQFGLGETGRIRSTGFATGDDLFTGTNAIFFGVGYISLGALLFP